MHLFSNICTVLVCLQLGVIDGSVIDASRLGRGAVSDIRSRNQRNIRGTRVGSLIVGADVNAPKNVSAANSLYPVIIDLNDLKKLIELKFSSVNAQIADLTDRISRQEEMVKTQLKPKEQAAEIGELQRGVVDEKEKKMGELEAGLHGTAVEIVKLKRRLDEDATRMAAQMAQMSTQMAAKEAELNRTKIRLQHHMTRKRRDLTGKVDAQGNDVEKARATEIEKLRAKLEEMQAEATRVERRINRTNKRADKIDRDLKKRQAMMRSI